MAMGGRRSHTKSRNGCSQCKARRIKCDERPPQCSHCARRQIECDFAHRPPSSATNSSVHRATASTSTLTSSDRRRISISLPKGIRVYEPAGLNVCDLELLHHFTTVTFRTLPGGSVPEMHDLWQVHVVQLSFQHEFLLRGILAVSALHLRYLSPRRYETVALQTENHQNISLVTFHEALHRANKSNCVAIFAFSCFIVVLGFGAARSPDMSGFQNDLFEWFQLIRGCDSVLQTHWDTVSRSFLEPLVKKRMIHETAASRNTEARDRVTDLLRLCAADRLMQDREAANAYALAIHELLNTYNHVALLMDRREDFVPNVFVWLITIPRLYLELMRDRQPEALVILAYYSALLQRIDEQWFMRDFARYLVVQIHSALPKEWHEWLAWPVEITGASSPLTR